MKVITSLDTLSELLMENESFLQETISHTHEVEFFLFSDILEQHLNQTDKSQSICVHILNKTCILYQKNILDLPS